MLPVLAIRIFDPFSSLIISLNFAADPIPRQLGTSASSILAKSKQAQNSVTLVNFYIISVCFLGLGILCILWKPRHYFSYSVLYSLHRLHPSRVGTTQHNEGSQPRHTFYSRQALSFWVAVFDHLFQFLQDLAYVMNYSDSLLSWFLNRRSFPGTLSSQASKKRNLLRVLYRFFRKTKVM